MDVKLAVVDGARPATIAIRLPTVVGRSSEAAVKVRNALVSRKHCELYAFDGEIAVRDLESSNGTFVNGQRIEAPTFLAPGDELTIGPVTLRADYEPASAEAATLDTLSVTDEAPDDGDAASAVSSVVRYNETEGGSFLGIEELESTAGRPEASDPPAKEAGDASDVTPSPEATGNQADESHEVLDFGGLGDATREPVDSGDSRLDDFFKRTP